MWSGLIFISLFVSRLVFFRSFIEALCLVIYLFLNCQEKRVKKLYLALAAARMPVGIVTHYMRPVNIAPRLISEGMISIVCNSDS